MNTILREITNNITQNQNQNRQETRENSLALVQEQNRFFDSRFGQAIDRGIDLGIRAIFPDFLEQSVINVKNTLIQEGLREGINKAVSEAVNMGRRAIDAVRGVFRSGNDARSAVEQGDLIGNVSKEIDEVVGKLGNHTVEGIHIGNRLAQGKEMMLELVRRNIDSSLSMQNELSNEMDGRITNWNSAFENEDFSRMQGEYEIITEIASNLMPTERLQSDLRKLENIHNLIKNNRKQLQYLRTRKTSRRNIGIK